MSLKGTLDSFQLGSLLQLLSNDQKTGVLRITDHQNEAMIYMKDGTIVYASSSKKEHQLGRILITDGIVSEHALKKGLETAKKKKQKIGKTLIQEGYLSLETLKEVLHHQVKEILCSLFFWKAGRFEFEEKALRMDANLVTKMNTLEIVLEASRRIDEWSLIKSEIENDELIFKICEKAQQKSEVNLNKNEWRILSLIDGRRTVRQIIKKSGCDDFSAFKSLCSLQLSGLVEQTEGGQVEDITEDIDYATVINIYNDVFQVARQSMETELGQSVFATFAECKKELLPDQQEIFQDFSLKNTPEKNVETVLKALEHVYDPESGRGFLVHSFTTLLQYFLDREMRALGPHLTKKTLDEISKTLTYVREYHKKTPEIEKILGKIETVTSVVERGPGEKKNKSSGLLGVFKAK